MHMFDASEQMAIDTKCFLVAALGQHTNTGYSNMKMQIGRSLFQDIRDQKDRGQFQQCGYVNAEFLIHCQIIIFFSDACLSLDYF